MKILTDRQLQEHQGTLEKLDPDMFSYKNVFFLLSAKEKNVLVSIQCCYCNINIFEHVNRLLNTLLLCSIW